MNALIATFVAQYTDPPPYHSTPAMDEMFTTCPHPRSTIPGEKARVHATTPFTLASSMVATSSMLFSVHLAVPSAPPALLTRMETSANSAGSADGRDMTASTSVTSSATQWTFAPKSFASLVASASRRSFAPRGDDEAASELGEALRGGLADAAGRAGDQGAPAGDGLGGVEPAHAGRGGDVRRRGGRDIALVANEGAVAGRARWLAGRWRGAVQRGW